MAGSPEQGRQNNPGNSESGIDVEKRLVDRLNTATLRLESINPNTRKLTRRGFLFTSLFLAGGGLLWRIRQDSQVKHQQEIRAALVSIGIGEVDTGDNDKWETLPLGKIVQEKVTDRISLFFLNRSRYGIDYDKTVLSSIGLYTDYPEHALVFRDDLIDTVENLRAGISSLAEDEFMVMATKQNIAVSQRVAGRDLALDKLMKDLLGVNDLSNFTDIQKEALGIALGIQVTVFFIVRLKYQPLSYQLDIKSADLSNPEIQKQVKERDQFELDLREKLFRGKLKPWFKVSII